ncbi:MAG: phenylalanine--tRNA ligase subunit beta [Patescibacteria group bacterium]
MKFSYLWLKDIIGFKETPTKLAELLTLRSFEIEGIEKIGNDYALDVKITANRLTDAGGHLGLAREIAAITNARFQEQKTKTPLIAKKFSIDIDILPSELCSRYSAQLIEIPTSVASPRWLQDRLVTCGLRPINAVVDVTNYIMLETGHPLHAFDAEKIIGKQMVIRESKRGEEITTLDGITRALPEGVIIIQDRNHIIDCAGIMGGENSAITQNTKTILLQAAVFDPVRIYHASRALDLVSAASRLYAAGVDFSESAQVLERATKLLEEITHANRIGDAYDWYPEKAIPSRILFHPDYADNIIGQANGSAFYQRVFTGLGFTFKKQGDDMLVEVLPRRRDIRIEQDLIEEAARLLGYEHITPRFPDVSLVPGLRNDEFLWQEKMRDILVAAGYTETEVYEFTGDHELSQFFSSPSVELQNPINAEQRYLTPRLLMKYVICAKENFKHTNTVNIFGVGKSFILNQKTIHERKDLCLALARKEAKGSDEFYELKGVIDTMLESLGIEEHGYSEITEHTNRSQAAIFHPYRVAEIKVGGKTLGMIGEIHPEILERLKSKNRIVAAELFVGVLVALANREQEYRPIGKFPAVRRDIAIVVPFNIKTESIMNVMEIAGTGLLIDTDLFDYFQDERMRGGQTKSLAFHLVFESPERTLTDKEVEQVMEKIINALEEQDWEVKK